MERYIRNPAVIKIMAKNKRWGKPFVDNRDWSKYNEHLVQRGEFYLSLDFIADWDTELSRMNSHKRGRRYLYPVLFIQWVAAIYVLFSMPYRQMEVFLFKNCHHLFTRISPLITRHCFVESGCLNCHYLKRSNKLKGMLLSR